MKYLIYLIAFWGCFCFNLSVFAQSIIQNKLDNILIQNDLEVLSDSLGKLTIQEVSSPVYADKFQKNYNNLAWLSKNQYKAHWLRLQLENQDSDERWLIGIDGNKIMLFDLQKDGKFKTYLTGDLVPMSQRYFGSMFSSYPYLPINLQKGERKVYYWRLETDIINHWLLKETLIRPTLIKYQNAVNKVREDTTYIMFVMGVIFIMTVYHFILAFFSQEKIYWYFAFYLLFSFGFLAYFTQFSLEYFFREKPYINRFYYFLIINVCTNIAFFWFNSIFLELRKHRPIWNNIVNFISFLFIINLFVYLLFLNPNSILVTLNIHLYMGAITYTMFIFLAFSLIWKNLLYAISVLAIFPVLVNLITVPILHLNLFAFSFLGLDIGFISQTALFAFGLAKRIQLINREKVMAQTNLILQLKENETIKDEANRQLETKVQERTQELQETNEELNTTLQIVEQERQKSEKLLLNILPLEVAEELKEKGYTEVRHYANTSVLFADVKGFSALASKVSPQELIKELDETFTKMDEIIAQYNLERIKTIGDCYMCAGGVPHRNTTNALDITLAALAIQDWMVEERIRRNGNFWQIRLGIHSGELVAGVIGKTKFAYDVWGNTVNTASRMESGGEVGKVNISETTYLIIKDFFDFTPRGAIEAKNIGMIETYFVDRIKPELSENQASKVPNELFLQLKNEKFGV